MLHDVVTRVSGCPEPAPLLSKGTPGPSIKPPYNLYQTMSSGGLTHPLQKCANDLSYQRNSWNMKLERGLGFLQLLFFFFLP